MVDGYHIPFRNGKKGTLGNIFCSINMHLGVELSRRDDLESLIYIIIFFSRGGNLPWTLSTDGPIKYSEVGAIKMKTSIDDLCKDQPAEFLEYLDYVKNLDYD